MAARKSTVSTHEPASLVDALVAALVPALAQALAQAGAPASAPATASAAAPVYVADPRASGRECVCGHAHKTAVVTAQRARLASETACKIKGCVSVPYNTCGR